MLLLDKVLINQLNNEKVNKSLLFGNGLNRIHQNNKSWNDLLKEIDKSISNRIFPKSIPNSMIYEHIVMGMNFDNERIYKIEENIKNDIAQKLRNIEVDANIYKLIYELEFENYLTTNYDHEFEKTIKINSNIEENNNEEIYSLRRKKKFINGNTTSYLWKLHGDIEKSKSIMLGLDHYCGSVSKIDSYIKGTYKFSSNKKLNSKINNTISPDKLSNKLNDNNLYDNYSWVELFFNSELHILGLSLDFSEIDLWWLLNRRARYMKDSNYKNLINNKIYYYISNNNINTDEVKEKLELLESFFVKVIIIDIECIDDKPNWIKYYIDCIKQISTNN